AGDEEDERRDVGCPAGQEAGGQGGELLLDAATGTGGDDGAEGVGDGEGQLDELDGDGGEKEGEGELDEGRTDEDGRALAVDGLDDGQQEHGQGDDRRHADHDVVVGGEPAGGEVDRRRRGQGGADLAEEPAGATADPGGEVAEDGPGTGADDGAAGVADGLADGTEDAGTGGDGHGWTAWPVEKKKLMTAGAAPMRRAARPDTRTARRPTKDCWKFWLWAPRAQMPAPTTVPTRARMSAQPPMPLVSVCSCDDPGSCPALGVNATPTRRAETAEGTITGAPRVVGRRPFGCEGWCGASVRTPTALFNGFH